MPARHSAASAPSYAAPVTAIMIFEVHALDPAAFQAWYDGKLAAANATPTPVPSGGGGPVLDLVAQGVKFDKSDLSAPANSPFTIDFDNQDAGTTSRCRHPRRVPARRSSTVRTSRGRASSDYGVSPLPAGAYKFECSIHPALMFGTLTVQ